MIGLAALSTSVRAQCPNGSPPPCQPTARAPSPTSVAVLYFDNASRDSSDAYLAEGLTEAVIAQLRQVGRLTVQSRSAVLRFRGSVPDLGVIRRTLGVSYLVTGSVQRAGHDLRVTIDLARTANGVTVWGNQFRGSDDSLFSLQDTIARRVAEGVVGQLLPAERRAVAAVRTTRNPVAYQHFLQGNHYLAQRSSTGLVRATAEYRQAAALDSSYVSALARVGLAYALRFDWAWDSAGAPPDDSLIVRGMEAADQALRQDSLNSDAWLARGYLLKFLNPRTWEGVLAAFRRATALDPTNAEAWHQMGDAASEMRDDSTAAFAFRRALAIDPARPITLVDYATTVALPNEVGALLDSAVSLDSVFTPARRERVLYRLMHNDTLQARRDLKPLACEACPPEMRTANLAWHALGLQFLGDTAAARIEMDKLLRWLRPTGALSWRVAGPITFYFFGQGDSAKALDTFQRIEPRDISLWALPWAPMKRYPLVRQILLEAAPPWAPPPARVLDLRIPTAKRTRWIGSYTGPFGRSEVFTRGDSLMAGDGSTTIGRLLYQGGESVIPSWDPEMRIVFDSGGARASGFTATRRNRVFPSRRVD